MRRVILSCSWILGLAACNASQRAGPAGAFDPSTNLTLTANDDRLLCNEDTGECFVNPCGCVQANIEIDPATGATRDTCIQADGTTDADCQDIVSCTVVTAPDRDCVVCAIVDGAVVFSNCLPSDPSQLSCKYYDRFGTGEAVPGGENVPPPDPNDEPNCDGGGTFAAGDGCNWCSCDADGTKICTERACIGCTPGDTRQSLDGCNVCTCMEDGTESCTEMACGGTCRVCTDAAGNVVVDECGDDCANVMCAQVLCADGFEPVNLRGECCETCVPIDDCADVACAPSAGFIVCPAGWRPVRNPYDCCEFSCEPESCENVVCPAVQLHCPQGTELVAGPPDCCPRCEPRVDYCTSDADCGPHEICSVSLGDCLTSPDCLPAGPCETVCTGICRPGECLLDFVCEDGTLPEGTECKCSGECLLDFVCEDGTLPKGKDCECPQK